MSDQDSQQYNGPSENQVFLNPSVGMAVKAKHVALEKGLNKRPIVVYEGQMLLSLSLSLSLFFFLFFFFFFFSFLIFSFF